MSNPMNAEEFFNQKAKAVKCPVVELSEEEFVKALQEAGFTEQKAKQCAAVSKTLGSMILVGNRNLIVKKGDES